jgi:hypothetical protein
MNKFDNCDCDYCKDSNFILKSSFPEKKPENEEDTTVIPCSCLSTCSEICDGERCGCEHCYHQYLTYLSCKFW